MGDKISLECCCCGGSAGKWEQWLNRDTGYGCCARCVEEEIKDGMTPERIKDYYGIAGVHREPAPSELTQDAAPVAGQHTPGPWRFEQPYGVGRIVKPGGEFIAVACGLVNDTVSAEARANAHLICAAPELLAALKGLIQAATDVIDVHGDRIWPDLAEDETPDLAAWTEKAQAAIAKAEGR